ncbi:putative methyltransferase [Gynuella sunshinyii YC6258]|uniref:Ribosomal RNA small subunit methyltransferase I n=1 Tax=Gynuella sunshinyii YC6258 TaxID=1445510 RepID=A0A0C5VJF5_9GAMM|nr:putative methyltransferase [Gynuella sunshinyii YC6258]
MSTQSLFGTLYIVATPIGNLSDITYRAVQILTEADLIFAEDTRNTRKLLDHYQVVTPVQTLHEHNEKESVQKVLALLKQGQNLALVSDAGTPLISDPGFVLVSELRKSGANIVPVPGPSAVIAALSVAGIATDHFSFEGFLPSKEVARQEVLAGLSDESRTMVFYEAPHRLSATLADMELTFGAERVAVLCRELTKAYETIHSAPLSELLSWVNQDVNQQRGEIVLVVQGVDKSRRHDELTSFDKHLLKTLLDELPLKRASVVCARLTGKAKRSFYDLGMQLQKNN